MWPLSRLGPAVDPILGSEAVHAEKTNSHGTFLPFTAGLMLSDV